MADYCVVTAELARARIFTLESSETPETEGSPYLVERKSLVNPQRNADASDLWTDTRRGAHREHQGGQLAGETSGIPHHNYDEHQDDNERMANRAFARDVVAAARDVIGYHDCGRLILCSEKQMLGFLRPELDALPRDGLKITEVPRDLMGLSAHDLHGKLAQDELLPPRKRPEIPT